MPPRPSKRSRMATDGLTEFAPAKINLCLHVTGRRADGYHLLDSLVVFAKVGDRVAVTPGEGLTLVVEGPEAKGLSAGDDNLVLRAARLMGVSDAALALEKNLPVASGIGGGSADAAATLRALSRLTGKALPGSSAVLALGADVPVCLTGHPARMRGVGEALSPLPPLPPLWLVLVNPRLAVATREVFGALARCDGAPVPELPAKGWTGAAELGQWLDENTRNDLEPPARGIAPVLAEVGAALWATTGCMLARMSGSGATCFGLYADEVSARAAAALIASAHPEWWIMPTAVRDQK